MITEQQRMDFNLLPIERRIHALQHATYVGMVSVNVGAWVFNSGAIAMVTMMKGSIRHVFIPSYCWLDVYLTNLEICEDGIKLKLL